MKASIIIVVLIALMSFWVYSQNADITPVQDAPADQESQEEQNSVSHPPCCPQGEKSSHDSAEEGEEHRELQAQTTCPVMDGNPISKDIYADYEGQRVYFCCPGCVSAFEEDPEKYIEKLREEGQKPETL
ncbi:MAG: YHS domain-containing protein [Fibrobacterota bacterium]|jgi:YHS domain-containing protein